MNVEVALTLVVALWTHRTGYMPGPGTGLALAAPPGEAAAARDTRRRRRRDVHLLERLVTFGRLFPCELGGMVERVLETFELAAVGAIYHDARDYP